MEFERLVGRALSMGDSPIVADWAALRPTGRVAEGRSIVQVDGAFYAVDPDPAAESDDGSVPTSGPSSDWAVRRTVVTDDRGERRERNVYHPLTPLDPPSDSME
jgi:hypothetical protein